jgi:hypothetical protein
VTRPIKPIDWYCTDMGRWLTYIYNRFDDEGVDSPKYKAMLHGLRWLVSRVPTGQDHNPGAARLPPEDPQQARRRAEKRYWRDVFHRLDVSAAKRQASLDSNPEPLHKFVPLAEDCVHEPPRKRGQTQRARQQAAHQEELARAAADVGPIRKILHQDFPDQSRQAITQKAVELAALRNGVDADDLAETMRRGRKHAS